MIYIIAAADLGMEADLDNGKRLVEEAKNAGADAVKFMGDLNRDQWMTLFGYCGHLKIDFLATPNSMETATYLNNLGMQKFRVDSSELTNLPLMVGIAGFRRHMIVSTGMSTLYEISEAVRVIGKYAPLTLLHSVSEYPTPIQNVNLKMIESLQMLFEVPVGFSDHTTSTLVPALAVVAGAEIIEKHFAMDKASDEQMILDTKELGEMVTNIRTAEVMLGSPIKKISQIERDIRRKLGK